MPIAVRERFSAARRREQVDRRDREAYITLDAEGCEQRPGYISTMGERYIERPWPGSVWRSSRDGSIWVFLNFRGVGSVVDGDTVCMIIASARDTLSKDRMRSLLYAEFLAHFTRVDVEALTTLVPKMVAAIGEHID